MIGRHDERRLLLAELAAAVEGRTRVALVGGDPGIGKTTVVAAIAADAARRWTPSPRTRRWTTCAPPSTWWPGDGRKSFVTPLP